MTAIYDLPKAVREDYVALRELPDGRIIGVLPLMFHWSLHIDIDACGYADKYCYQLATDAVLALKTWDGEGDPPAGWHRHLATGRRRDLETGEEWIQW